MPSSYYVKYSTASLCVSRAPITGFHCVLLAGNALHPERSSLTSSRILRRVSRHRASADACSDLLPRARLSPDRVLSAGLCDWGIPPVQRLLYYVRDLRCPVKKTLCVDQHGLFKLPVIAHYVSQCGEGT